MKSTKHIGFILAAALVTFACSKPNNTVETSDAQEIAQGEGVSLTLNTSESRIAWAGYKPAGEHHGKIPATQGTITVSGNQIISGTFTFDVTGLKIEDMPVEDENYGKLYGHLQSPDFFDAANYPTATFEITAVEPFSAGDQIVNKEEFSTEHTPKSNSELQKANLTHWISGNLTMRGTTKNIKFPAAVSLENGRLTTKAGFNIDRTAWGLSYGDEAGALDKAKDQFIYNTVSLTLDITAN
jgi:polyisoprenoid-binding protein YceI